MCNIDGLLKMSLNVTLSYFLLFIYKNFQSLKIIEINSTNPYLNFCAFEKVCFLYISEGAGAASKFFPRARAGAATLEVTELQSYKIFDLVSVSGKILSKHPFVSSRHTMAVSGCPLRAAMCIRVLPSFVRSNTEARNLSETN
jgi:hypothetical protein